MEEEREVSFLAMNKENSGIYHDGKELRRFRAYLRWVYVDQSNLCKAGISWSVFFTLAYVVPILSHFLLDCSTTCDADHRRPYHVPVQISLSVFATLSFISLSKWDRKYGFSKFLFLDKVSDESLKIQRGYAIQMKRTMKLILLWGLPCFICQCVYKIWWYISGASQIPYYGEVYVSGIILCTLELCSWFYRTSIFFLVCVLFRLIGYLQIQRLDEFAPVFQRETEVGTILLEHLRIRRNLRVISHRFRAFILSSLLLVTASQLIFLLMVIKPHADVDILKGGELGLVSITLVSGLYILLRSATKITHKAQSLTGLASKWHICATINSFDNIDGETPTALIASAQAMAADISWGSSEDESGDEEDELNNTKMMPIQTRTISFHKRQALVTYMENNRAGITVYGFMLDRTWLHSIFGIQLALCLWLLNKTVGI
ncbi:hypothetical protein MtrunA17_Chr2g0289391 [Medicago truncatula]|uniref:AT3g20300/MQC12_5 n=1 Tax=Medicago truncatula TaxID=3880 RepID=Q2HTI8_MEDTR|nr:uncharacterized protein LOC11443885 [Medicago truncatula]ABD32643.1 AT3g20300/MQC12_5 [Medicago truncatula]AES64416.1 extracellular ligand-gated ion channel protein [Medicago truncatula]RHN72595.1 hypothetical protein MtrunA17_Chr2g0289391 [Medicago truncatula]